MKRSHLLPYAFGTWCLLVVLGCYALRLFVVEPWAQSWRLLGGLATLGILVGGFFFTLAAARDHFDD